MKTRNSFKSLLILLFFLVANLSLGQGPTPPPPGCDETTWNGTSWNNGFPDVLKVAVFTGNFSSSGNITCCEIRVYNNANVVINSGHYLNVSERVIIESLGTLTFENSASLVQNNPNALNEGSIIYKRNSTPIRFDRYTYWSSPVANQTLAGISTPGQEPTPILNHKPYLQWNTLATPSDFPVHNDAGKWELPPSSTIMEIGRGYGIKGPLSYNPNNGIQNMTFTGTPNNGTITRSVWGNPITPVTSEPCVIPKHKKLFIGNPYPSAIEADAFLADNNNKLLLAGTIEFYTHGTPPSGFVEVNNGNAYTARDITFYNRLGGIGTRKVNFNQPIGANNSDRSTGNIAAAQGFFARGIGNGDIVFTNNMRVDGSEVGDTNGQFYRMAGASGSASRVGTIDDKHRIWFSIEKLNGGVPDVFNYHESLVGYCTGATNNTDHEFDFTLKLASEKIKIYSLKNNSIAATCEPMSIQGRALPFNVNDVIPLGFIATVTTGTTQTFRIEAFGDGMFAAGGQKYYLKDNVAGLIHDIENNPYTFTLSTSQTNDARFEIIFNPYLTQVQPSQCGVILSSISVPVLALNVAPAQAYKWHFTRDDGQVAVYETVLRQIQLSNLCIPSNFIRFDATYSVGVCVKVNNVWHPYSVFCNLTTPPYPVTEISNIFWNSQLAHDTAVTCTNVNGSYSACHNKLYRFKLTEITDSNGNGTLDQYEYTNPTHLNNTHVTQVRFGSILPLTQYDMQVCYGIGGEFGPYGPAHMIITPAIFANYRAANEAQFNMNVKYYPNPFKTNFTLDLIENNQEKISVKVYDMIGKLVEEREIDSTIERSIQLGDDYKTGIYNVVIQDGDEVKTQRIIKN